MRRIISGKTICYDIFNCSIWIACAICVYSIFSIIFGMNGARVNAIVNELRGEKIDIINWSDNAAMLIENALSPAKVISVIADAEEKTAKVVVPDYQLSLAIGKEGQNARLAARLTGFKIDIKSETQAREAGDFMDYENDYEEYEEDDYSDDYAGDYEEASEDGYAGDYDEVSEDDYTGDYEEASEDSYAGDYDEVPKENYAELNEEPLSKESTGQGESDE